MNLERIQREIAVLREGGQDADLVQGDRLVVIYRAVPTDGKPMGLPDITDVIAPVPGGYPASLIDLAGLPVGSPLIAHVKGGGNNQGIVTAAGRQWQLASYHPHNGGGGPPWDQMRHGFHTYLDQLIAWLHCLN
jgi:hypothetical protein